MKISVSSYSYQQYIKAGKMTQLDVVKKAYEMGISGIDFIDLQPNAAPTLEDQLAYAAEIRKEAEKYGIEIVAYTIGANLYTGSKEGDEKEVERLKGQVRVAAALGAKLMRHDVCKGEKLADGRVVGYYRMLPTIAENARKVTEYAQTFGIRTTSENHGFVAQDSDRVEALYNAVGHENYGLLIDIGNFACADEDSAHAVSRLASYAFHVHAKDFIFRPASSLDPEGFIRTRGGNYIRGTVLGHGVVPLYDCVKLLKQSGYEGTLSLEFEGLEDNIPALEMGYRTLRRLADI